MDSGEVTLGGVNVKDYSMNSLMSNFSFVFQSVYLFADTIENNIKFGRQDASHEEVVEAAKKACCHDFISKLPDGYEDVYKRQVFYNHAIYFSSFYISCHSFKLRSLNISS